MNPPHGNVTFGETDDLADEPVATPAQTRAEFLDRTKSGYAKVRFSLIQVPGTRGSQPTMLSKFSRNHRALVLYLALLANGPWMRNEDEPLPAGAWLRFLKCDDPKALTWTPQSLSHAWGVLEGLGLITRERSGRLKDIKPRREDGKADYTWPKGDVNDPYLVLPHTFWLDQYHGTLSWPALAVLLILLKETGKRKTAQLAIDRAKDWYGISRTTAEAGLAELRSLALLLSADRMVKDVNTSEGRRRTSEHTLTGPFSVREREALRAAAKQRVNGSKVAFETKATRKRKGKGASDDEDAASA